MRILSLNFTLQIVIGYVLVVFDVLNDAPLVANLTSACQLVVVLYIFHELAISKHAPRLRPSSIMLRRDMPSSFVVPLHFLVVVFGVQV